MVRVKLDVAIPPTSRNVLPKVFWRHLKREIMGVTQNNMWQDVTYDVMTFFWFQEPNILFQVPFKQ